MAPLQLEALPNEILGQIMGSVSVPANFLSLTHASPQCFRLYNGNKKLVKTVVLRMIPPENMPLAMAACAAPKTQHLEERYGYHPRGLAKKWRAQMDAQSKTTENTDTDTSSKGELSQQSKQLK